LNLDQADQADPGSKCGGQDSLPENVEADKPADRPGKPN
jgi:hypothetical protein